MRMPLALGKNMNVGPAGEGLILDVGCGPGRASCKTFGEIPATNVISLDLDLAALTKAKSLFPGRRFFCGKAESLPLKNNTFVTVFSNVALPYMDPSRALAEMYRVLRPGGRVLLAVHPLSFTWSEIVKAFPRPWPLLSRLFVIANGLQFYLTGTVGKIGSRTESWQSERGMRLALRRAGFGEVVFARQEQTLLVQAIKPPDPQATFGQ